MRFHRSLVLGIVAAVLALAPARAAPADDAGADKVLTREAVLRDADNPVLGNPDGDITIVEYFDYQCPYCRKVAPVLAQVMREDGKLRVVLKDWPILGQPSRYAARLVLAAKFQGKYQAANEALIGRGGRLTEADADETLAAAGVDLARAKADLDANKNKIDALLRRNDLQAQAFGFRGTPAFIVGTFRVPQALTAEQFKQAIADARALAKGAQPGR
ncbi:MAG: DsbA family protein [Hyphomicrobiales bacterium]|nr:DsbA family protein [Hyphomicrobiales bacterium]